ITEPVTRIYPNPTNNILNIEISKTGRHALEIEIFTLTGKLIYQKEYRNTHANFVGQIDLSAYTKGVYLLKVRQADSVYVGKVVVN
ncbi:MAG: T9SS type A sorting domain-containing protein, partial [Bacteroidales bacterium]